MNEEAARCDADGPKHVDECGLMTGTTRPFWIDRACPFYPNSSRLVVGQSPRWRARNA